MIHRILVVDDDPDMQRLLHRKLVGARFEVVTAVDGVSATMVARKDTPDAVVLDVGLPGGDGLLVLERLKSLIPTAHTPVIVVTGREGPRIEQEARERGASAFFRKPVDPSVLIGEIRAVLDGA